jgi:hypothetical protein
MFWTPLANAVPVVPIPGVYGTGVDNNGNALAAGTVDPHYVLIQDPNNSPNPKPKVTSGNPATWVGNQTSPAARWINPTGAGSGSFAWGTYIYELTFYLDAPNDPTTALITGRWASDNDAQMFLNGGTVPISSILFPDPSGAPYSFDHLTDFSISTGFLSGVNTLDFVVHNAFTFISDNRLSPTGLIVQITGATVDPPETPSPPSVPEPSSVLLFAAGLTGLAWWRRRVIHIACSLRPFVQEAR